MGIDKDLEEIFHGDTINDMIADLVENQTDIDHLVIIYDKKESELLYVSSNEGTDLPMTNLMLDEAKNLLLNGGIEEDECDE
jgi:hypothetical protein